MGLFNVGDEVVYKGYKVRLARKLKSSTTTQYEIEPTLVGALGPVHGVWAWESECEPVKPVEPPPRKNVCQEADEIAGQGGDRMRDYGHPLDNHKRIADGWAVILGHPVTPSQAALCMIWVKVARQLQSPKRDNLTDICGYAKCLEMIIDEEGKRAGDKTL